MPQKLNPKRFLSLQTACSFTDRRHSVDPRTDESRMLIRRHQNRSRMLPPDKLPSGYFTDEWQTPQRTRWIPYATF
ncbi:hypothetical protein TNCT_282781 [Trichonephila clavata]|uniref:Uncharacterized protein n=1 Tax=Trichonephila clavata TaxID=2740835 RepID=A0A8X6HI45_TRICU|nr:hypothetical protein TNCT_282781 [Trichonephila clavata]